MAGYNSYLPFALEVGLLSEGSPQYHEVEIALQMCLKAEQTRGVSVHIPECEGVMSKLFEVTLSKAYGLPSDAALLS